MVDKKAEIRKYIREVERIRGDAQALGGADMPEHQSRILDAIDLLFVFYISEQENELLKLDAKLEARQ